MLPKNTPEIIAQQGYAKCFGCGRENPVGLKLDFSWDGQTASAQFTPGEWHQGWPGVVHGGILGIVLDEAMTYVPYFQKIYCVTGRMEVRFKSQVRVGEPLLVSAQTTRQTRKLIECQSSLARSDGSLVAEGKALFYIVNGGHSSGGNNE